MNLAKEWTRASQQWDRWLFYASAAMLMCVLVVLRGDLVRFTKRLEQEARFLEKSTTAEDFLAEAWVNGLIDNAQGRGPESRMLSRNLFARMVEGGSRSTIPAQVRIGKTRDTAKPQAGVPISLLKIFRKPVRLLFKGYIRLPGDSYSLQINWAGLTDFKEVGESIRGYTIETFEKILESAEGPGGYVREIDNSYVVIRKSPKDPVTLKKGKLVTEKELFAKVMDIETRDVVTVHVGSKVGQYKVVDITEDKVLVSGPLGDKLQLTRSR